MSTFGTVFHVLVYVLATLVGFYGGWLLIFRTSTIVSRAHKTYGFKFFLKPWYSIFLRSMGIIVLLLVAISDYAQVAVR
jgi:hypothetical protein